MRKSRKTAKKSIFAEFTLECQMEDQETVSDSIQLMFESTFLLCAAIWNKTQHAEKVDFLDSILEFGLRYR